MKINEIKYSRVFNLGNYENETISVSAFVEEGELADIALKAVVDFVSASKTNPTKAPTITQQQITKPQMPVKNHAPMASNSAHNGSGSMKSVQSDNSAGEYVIQVGKKYKGKKVKEVKPTELENYLNYLYNSASESKKPVTKYVTELADAYQAYYGNPPPLEDTNIPF